MAQLIPSSATHKRKLNAYTVLIILFVSLGSVTYGYAAAIIGPTLGQPLFIEYFELATRPNGTDLLSCTNGLFQTGGVIGTLCLPFFADRWGRRVGILISALLVMISGAALAASTHIGVFLAFRFISGCGTFMILAAVPLFMAEVTPPHIRGALVNIHAISLVFGYFFSGWFSYSSVYWPEMGNLVWRVPITLQCVWPFLLCLGLWWVPESPRWLLMNDRAEEAERVLLRLHGGSSEDNDFAKAELYQIQKQVELDRTLDTSWLHIWRSPSLRKRMLLTLGTTGFIQCSGVLVINNYGPILYKGLNFTPKEQLLYPAAWLTLAVGLNAMASLFVDLIPRNRMLSIGVLGCMATLIVFAALIAQYASAAVPNEAALRAAVAMLFIFEIPYDICLDGLQFTYISEIWPNHLRAKGMSAGVAMISLMNIAWLQSAPTAFQTIGWKFYLAFIIPGTIGGIAIWLFWPDTMHKPLEEVAAIFGDIDDVVVYQEEVQVKNGEIHVSHVEVRHDEKV